MKAVDHPVDFALLARDLEIKLDRVLFSGLVVPIKIPFLAYHKACPKNVIATYAAIYADV